jgi:hypothetical protein
MLAGGDTLDNKGMFQFRIYPLQNRGRVLWAEHTGKQGKESLALKEEILCITRS